ncbi:universal stress protein [Microbacterium sp. cf332]|uniref:universal stress protein n=1 Tax=Microbacterium sp. cf332 TaxID=1761804 RepID=UPI00352363F0
MSDESELPSTPVIVGVIPGQSPRVVVEAARYASMLGVGLIVVHVDVTRFVTYEDPDGYVHTAPIDLGAVSSAAQFEQIRAGAAEALASTTVDWTVHQLVGDPALAIKHLADRLDAKLLVVGTRRRGIGESIREFFTGSVAARLAHRQQRPVLVVPQGRSVADDEDLWAESPA